MQKFSADLPVPGTACWKMNILMLSPHNYPAMKSIILFLLFLIFSQAIYSQTAQIADRFDYPIADRGIGTNSIAYELPERITALGGESNNNLYPHNLSMSNTRCAHSTVTGQTYNAQDVGSYLYLPTTNGIIDGYHPGEDWHIKNQDIGAPVYAVANGEVVLTGNAFTQQSCGGQFVIIKHVLPDATVVYSYYVHVGTVMVNNTTNKIVTIGQQIAEIADVTCFSDHLHFEIRIANSVPASIWDGAYLGYYPNATTMQSYGIVDPSDFIDAHRTFGSPINGNIDIYVGKAYNDLHNRVKIWGYFAGANNSFTVDGFKINGFNKTFPAVVNKQFSNGKCSFELDFSQMSPAFSSASAASNPFDFEFDITYNSQKKHYYSKKKLYFLDTTDYQDMNTVSYGDYYAHKYIAKGTRNGLFKGSKNAATGVWTFRPNDTLTKGQAAKVIVTALLKLDMIAGINANGTLPAPASNGSSEFKDHVLTLMNNNVVLPLDANNAFDLNQRINVEELCWLITESFDLPVLTAKNSISNLSWQLFSSTARRNSAIKVAKTFVEIENNNNDVVTIESLASFFGFTSSSALGNNVVLGTAPVKRSTMAKILTNAYLLKAKQLNTPVYNILGASSSLDFFVLGDKFESTDNPTGTLPALSTQIQSSYTINDNDSVTISHASNYDAANNGAPLYFYWTAGGGDTLRPLTGNFRSVLFVPGAVSQPTTFKLYTQCGNTNGKIREYHIDVHVNPTNPASTTTAPTQQAANLQFPNNGYNDIVATWTRGNGDRCIVTCTPTGHVPVLPQAGMVYAGNSNYNLAPAVGSSTTKVVYTGNAASVNITGLLQQTAYRIQVFEYNGNTNATVKYNLVNYPNAVTQTAVIIPTQSSFTWTGYPIIAGNSYQFLATAQNANGFSWSVSPAASISASNQAGTNISFPSAGTYQVTLTAANSFSSQTNSHTEPITVLAAGNVQADALVQNIVSSPATVQAGQSSMVTCMTSNTSSFSLAYGMVIRYYISTDQAIDAGDWAAGQETVNLNPGQSQTISHSVAVPVSYSGNYYILLKIDATNQVSESNENNNEGSVAIHIVPSLPDLIIQSMNISPSTSFASGATLNVSATLRNAGLNDLQTGSPSTYLYLSQDNVPDQFDYKLSYVLVCNNGSIPPNTTATASNNNVVIPANLPSGNWYLIGSVDNDLFASPPTGMNAESNETNNTFSLPIVLSNPNQPSTQVTDVTISNITPASLRLNWTNGNGNRRIVTVKQNNIPDLPVDNNSYTGNANYAAAAFIPTTSTRVLYTGTGNFVDVTNLQPNTDYTFNVLEYNDLGTVKDYLQASNLRGIMTHTPVSNNSSAGWTIQTNTYSVYGLQFVNDNTGYGLMGTSFAKSDDGGKTWQLYEIVKNHTEVMNAFHFVNVNEGILSTPNGNIYKTINGGKTWTHTSNAGGRFVNKVQMVSPTVIFLACAGVNNTNNGAVLKSTDGGVNWTTVLAAPSRIELLQFTSGNTGWVIAQDRTIYKTTNSGTNWNTQTILNNCAYPFSDLSLVDDQTGWLVNGCRDVYKTSNGGTTWSLQSTQSGSPGSPKIKFVDGNTGVYVLPPDIKLSLNGGSTWVNLPNSNTVGISSPMYLSARSSNMLWTGGGGGLYKTATGGDTSGITLTGISPVTLCQGDSVHVTYSVNGSYHANNNIQLELSDSLGQFTNPVVLALQSSQTGGTVHALLPASIAASAYYKLRLSTTQPVTYSNVSAPLSVATGQLLTITNLQTSYSTQAASFTLAGSPVGGSFLIDNIAASVFNPAVLTPGVHTVTYQYSINSCSYSVQYTVYIIEPLKIDLQTLSAGAICAGGNVTVSYLTAGVFDSTNIFTVELSDNSGSFSTPIGLASLNSIQSGSVNFPIPANTSPGNGYKVRMISSQNIISDTLALTVNTAVMPVASIVTSDTIICAGTNAVFTVTGSHLGSTPGYQWLLNGVAAGTNAAQYFNNTLVDGDVVQVKVSVNAVCAAQSEVFADMKTIIVIAMPDTPAISQFDTILVSSSPVGNQWYQNGMLLPGQTNQFLIINQPGLYTVKVAATPCDTVASALFNYNMPQSGIQAPLPARTVDRLFVFPNPTREMVQVKFATEEKGVYGLTLHDAQGRKVGETEINVQQTANTVSYSLKGLVPGIYYLRLLKGNHTLAIERVEKL